MTVDHERGAYAPPTDGPLTFDARQPVRGGGPAPMTLILSVLVLAGLVAALFFFYQAGERKGGGAPETVGTSVAEITAPAPTEAQPTDPAAGLQIYRSDEGGPMETLPAEPKFVAPPEEPAPRAAPTAKVVVAQAPPAAAPPAIRAALPPAPAAPKVAEQKVAPPPAKAAAAPPPPAKATPAPVEKAAATSPPKTASGGAVVQIGAVGSTALADKAWNDAVAAAPGLAAGKGKSVEKIERDGGTLYRTAVTGFASRADAQAFCQRLQSAGKSCFVR
jgi:outer membrane biosynthesis protein TonB